jgi:hypothetical protein
MNPQIDHPHWAAIGRRNRRRFVLAAWGAGVVLIIAGLASIMLGRVLAAMVVAFMLWLMLAAAYVKEHGNRPAILHPWKGSWRLYLRLILMAATVGLLAALWKAHPRPSTAKELAELAGMVTVSWLFMWCGVRLCAPETIRGPASLRPGAVVRPVTLVRMWAVCPAFYIMVLVGFVWAVGDRDTPVADYSVPTWPVVVYAGGSVILWLLARLHDDWPYGRWEWSLDGRPFSWQTMRPLKSNRI